MSLFKDTLRKVPWWAWVFFPIVLVVLVIAFFRKGGGLGEMLSLPSAKTPPGPTAPPAITEAEAEEKREEAEEVAETETEASKKETQAELDGVDEWLKTGKYPYKD